MSNAQISSQSVLAKMHLSRSYPEVLLGPWVIHTDFFAPRKYFRTCLKRSEVGF